MAISFNTNPYYDDFDSSKNYVKILFKPGTAVQARELTQLQTSLQAQISRHGSYSFKEGSMVLGNMTHNSSVLWVDVVGTSLTGLKNTTITGDSSNATGRVILASAVTSTTYRLYYVLQTENTFTQADNVSTETGDTYPVVSGDTFSGVATTFSISDSVFFFKSCFVFFPETTIVVSDSGDEINRKIGFIVTENIVSSNEDNTLLDNSQGSSNYAAPGADRYQIDLQLVSIDKNDTTFTDFAEISRFENSVITKDLSAATSVSSYLEDNLARRTYDESGNYTVKAFGAKAVEGVETQSIDNFSIKIDAGKAYIKGYEFETLVPTYVDIPRSLETALDNGSTIPSDFTKFIYIEAPTAGAINFVNNTECSLQDVSSNEIATFITKGITYFSAGVYKLYIANVNIIGTYAVSSATKVVSGGFTANISTSAYGLSDVSIVNAFRTPNIIPLEHPVVKTLLIDGVSDTSYITIKSFSGSISTNTITLSTGSSSENFYGSDVNDYVVIDQSSGLPLTITNVSNSSSSVILTSSTASATVVVYAKIAVSSFMQKNKTVQTITITETPATTINLGYSDCYQLIKVTAKDTTLTLDDLEITGMYDFDNGQRDELYDHGSITLKNPSSFPTGYNSVEIEFSYFTQSSIYGYFSVDSYIDYDNIPVYTSSDGTAYNLRDCLDFRPRRTNGGSSIIGTGSPLLNFPITVDITYYLPRTDKLVLTKERKFSLVQGIPSENAQVPIDINDAMTLYVINVPAYTKTPEEIKFSYVDNRRFTMRDIGNIERRVERLEYYTTLSFLEKQANEEQILDSLGVERFKNGIVVDSFVSHAVGEVTNIDYSCSIDTKNKILRPKISSHSFNYVVSTLGTAVKNDDIITLPYTTEALIEQPFATTWENVNPYMVFTWTGELSMNPATDTWVDTVSLPDVITNVDNANDIFTIAQPSTATGAIFNDWQTLIKGSSDSNTTTQIVNGTAITIDRANDTITRDIGTKVVNISIIPYIRSRRVDFAAKNMKPNTTLFASFDGVNVSSYCTQAIEVIFNTSSTYSKYVGIRSGSKSARVLLSRNDSALCIMDPGSSLFAINDTLEFKFGESWVSGGVNVGSVVYNTGDDTLVTNDKGDIAGSFYIPNNDRIKFSIGERIFKLYDIDETTLAETKYVAQGLSQETQRNIVATRIPTITAPAPAPAPVPVVEKPPLPKLKCGETASNGGQVGTFEYEVDFGTDVGQCGINYVAYSIPDRYTIIWNGNTYTTGFVGSTSYNAKLNALGYPNVTSEGTGSLLFNKTLASPSKAILRVEGVITGTGWRASIRCPATNTIPATSPSNTVRPYVVTPISYYMRKADENGVITSERALGIAMLSHTFPGNTDTTYALTSLTSSNPKISIVNVRKGQNKYTNPYTLGTPLSLGGLYKTPLVFYDLRFNKSDFPSGSNLNTTITASWSYVSGQQPSNNSYLSVSSSRTVDIKAIRYSELETYVDPLAQSFYIDEEFNPNGVFIDSIDLYFRRKASSIPVSLQIRTMKNGFPTTTVLPFATCDKLPEDINISSNGTVATRFKLTAPVHLVAGEEYAFVVLSNSDEYLLYTSVIGQYSLVNNTQRVSTQPTLGSLFKSQNASTWTPVQEEDIKFKLNKCVFNTSAVSTVELNTDISSDYGDVEYDIFFTDGENVDFDSTNIDYYVKPGGVGSWVPYQIGTNMPMADRKTLLTSDGSTLNFRVDLSSQDEDISPVIDMNRLSNVLVKNHVNNSYTNENLADGSGGEAYSKYITKSIKLNPGFESSDLRCFFVANIPTECSVKVYYKVGTAGDSNFADNTYYEMTNEYISSPDTNGFAEYKFKCNYTIGDSTTALPTGEKFVLFSIKLVMLSSNSVSVPQIKDLRILAIDD